MGESADRQSGVLPGTLDMLVLKALSGKAMHGYDVAEYILSRSGDLVRVEEGALYPALHRLELRGLLESEWGVSSNNRRAKFYRLTVAGQKRLAAESSQWSSLSTAIARVMEA